MVSQRKRASERGQREEEKRRDGYISKASNITEVKDQRRNELSEV